MGRLTGAERAAGGVAVLLAGNVPVYLVLNTGLLNSTLAGSILFLGVLGSFALAHRWGLTRDRAFLGIWGAISVGTAVVSILTGYHNGLTDEPYTTPRFLQLWPNLYGSPIHISYFQYGSGPHTESEYFSYLPFLPWIQVPGLDYRWVTFGSWMLVLLRVRRNGSGLTLLASPWVALLGASGFNDFVPFLALTLLFTSASGWSARAAEVVALGLKQFANVVVVAYYVATRRWWEALLAALITVAILLPFAVLDASRVWCDAILLQPTGCGSRIGPMYGAEFLTHFNYFLWPIFVLAIFGPRYVAHLRGAGYDVERAEARSMLGVTTSSGVGSGRDGWVLMLLPLLRLRRFLRGQRIAPK
ncbi:MAG: hypothetical protein ACLQD8_05320 [Thermoplasmata archaeon]